MAICLLSVSTQESVFMYYSLSYSKMNGIPRFVLLMEDVILIKSNPKNSSFLYTVINNANVVQYNQIYKANQ